MIAGWAAVDDVLVVEDCDSSDASYVDFNVSDVPAVSKFLDSSCELKDSARASDRNFTCIVDGKTGTVVIDTNADEGSFALD